VEPPPEKYSLAAWASRRAVAAYSPQTNSPGKKAPAKSDVNQSPLASSSEAASHVSIAIGDDRGAFSEVVSASE